MKMKLFTKTNGMILLVLVVGYLLYTRLDHFNVATSGCPTFCARNPGNMHPACVQGRKEGRPHCGTGGFT
jgi:hypothetical protein